MNYPRLREPGFIGHVRIKNRLIRAGSNQGFPPDYADGYLQSYYSDFYLAMAKGGVGMVTIGASPVGAPPGRGYRIDDDRYLPSLREFTDKMHAYDCPVFMQMFHIGPWLPGELSAAASTLPEPEMPITTQSIPEAHALTIDEIASIVREFGQRAERAQKAGFDGVELNAGCTHLFSTFLSRLWNRRQDHYGCATLENRARIVVEVIKEIRERTGDAFAVVVLFNPIEPGVPNGINAEEGLGLAKLFEAAGADALIPRVEYYVHHLFDGKNDSSHFPDVILYPEAPESVSTSGIDASQYGACGWVPLQTAIKKAVQIPVIAVGRMTPELGEKLLESGQIDFISMTRNLIADPEYPAKLFKGALADIAPCTACMTCFDLGERQLPVTCRVNPAAFNEAAYALTPAAQVKKVVVVGGGPAGMEAARVAALRGHRVTLLERDPILGGAMNAYAVIMGKGKEDVLGMVTYLETQLTKAGVDVRLRTAADRSVIERFNPDAVVIAVGGHHTVPEVPGIEQRQVLSSQRLHAQLKHYLVTGGGHLMEALDRQIVPVGHSVAIIGGDFQATQTAEFLIKRGCTVSIVESGPEIGAHLLKHLVRPQVIDYFHRHNVALFTQAEVQEITEQGVFIRIDGGMRQLIAADSVVIALPFTPNDALYASLQGFVERIHHIGDSRQPGKIVDAMADGARIGRAI